MRIVDLSELVNIITICVYPLRLKSIFTYNCIILLFFVILFVKSFDCNTDFNVNIANPLLELRNITRKKGFSKFLKRLLLIYEQLCCKRSIKLHRSPTPHGHQLLQQWAHDEKDDGRLVHYFLSVASSVSWNLILLWLAHAIFVTRSIFWSIIIPATTLWQNVRNICWIYGG